MDIGCNNALSNVGVEAAQGLCVEVYRDELVVENSRPRSLVVHHNGQVFGLEHDGSGEDNDWETSTGHVMAYFDNGATSETLVSAVGLTHGLAVDDSYIYSSSADTVYRWPYTFEEGQFIVDNNHAQVVIENIPSTPNQVSYTRSLLLDHNDQTTLYVSIGAEHNVESDIGRAGIRSFSLSTNTALPLNWNNDGTVIATGLRNAIGMALDRNGTLWALDTSAKEKYRTDLGGDISGDNPAEELNKIIISASSSSSSSSNTYGFPFCWSEYQLNPRVSYGRGSQWAWHDPNIFPIPKTESWCRNTTNNIPPQGVFPAHTHPLGLDFYRHQEIWPHHCPQGVAFPSEWDGHAFVALHGNYNDDDDEEEEEETIAGQVVRVPISKDGNVIGGLTGGEIVSVLKDRHRNRLSGIMPVDVKFDDCGRLLVTSDGKTSSLDGRMILRIQSGTPGSSIGGNSSSNNNNGNNNNSFSIAILGGVVALLVIVGAILLRRPKPPKSTTTPGNVAAHPLDEEHVLD